MQELPQYHVTTGSAGQNGNISVSAGNSCGTSSANTLAVTVSPGTPAQPGAISGTAAQCPGLTNQTYSISAVANATTYTWTVPAGWTITSGAGTTSINVTTGSAGQNGSISVSAGNSCGTSSANTLSVTVSPGTPATAGSNIRHSSTVSRINKSDIQYKCSCQCNNLHMDSPGRMDYYRRSRNNSNNCNNRFSRAGRQYNSDSRKQLRNKCSEFTYSNRVSRNTGYTGSNIRYNNPVSGIDWSGI